MISVFYDVYKNLFFVMGVSDKFDKLQFGFHGNDALLTFIAYTKIKFAWQLAVWTFNLLNTFRDRTSRSKDMVLSSSFHFMHVVQRSQNKFL